MSSSTTLQTTNSDFDEQQLLLYSDADLLQYILKSPRHPSSGRVFVLSSSLLAKLSSPGLVEDEVRAMVTARQLGVRVPIVKRVVGRDHETYLIMEGINGTTLDELWSRIGWVMAIKLAFQVRHFIYCLRSATSSTAGSLVSGECRSFYLDDRYNLPPRSTPEVITSFIKFWLYFTPSLMRKGAKPATSNGKKYLPPSPKFLYLTHHDLAPRNILIDDCGRPWILDWEYSGWYPLYFEYASMQNFYIPEDWGWATRLRWKVFSWISVGIYEKERHVLEGARTKFIRFPVGRRNAVMHYGAPAKYLAS